MRADALRALAPAPSAQGDPCFTQHRCDVCHRTSLHFGLEFLVIPTSERSEAWGESAVFFEAAMVRRRTCSMAQVTPQLTELLEKALALSTRDRGLVIDRLIAGLDEEPTEEGLEAAWDEEIERPVDDICSGRVKTIPGGTSSRTPEGSAARCQNLGSICTEPGVLEGG